MFKETKGIEKVSIQQNSEKVKERKKNKNATFTNPNITAIIINYKCFNLSLER